MLNLKMWNPLHEIAPCASLRFLRLLNIGKDLFYFFLMLKFNENSELLGCGYTW